MNQEKQRIAIAEACGYSNCHWRGPADFREFVGKRILEGGEIYPGCRVPDYLNDLNAIHEAVETLRHKDGSEWWDFRVHLADICGSAGNCIQATAAQRAEAFLKTLGLWTEEE